LFIGRQAKRKGLPILLEAISALRRVQPVIEVELHVVSSFDDGPLDIPSHVKVHSDLGEAALLQLFRDAHIFAMPTLSEAYGRVFSEAMCYGCYLLYPDWKPSAVLWANAGKSIDVYDSNAIADAIRLASRTKDHCLDVALRNVKMFHSELHHEVVGRQYMAVFSETLRDRNRNKVSG
jgi:glycosyltransferase involved in cell wall biosynthesis